MKVIYLIAICVNVFCSLIYLLRRDYSASRESLILAFLFVILWNPVKEADE